MDLVADPETERFAPIPHGQGRTILREALSGRGGDPAIRQAIVEVVLTMGPASLE